MQGSYCMWPHSISRLKKKKKTHCSGFTNVFISIESITRDHKRSARKRFTGYIEYIPTLISITYKRQCEIFRPLNDGCFCLLNHEPLNTQADVGFMLRVRAAS